MTQTAQAPVLERSITTKVSKVAASDQMTTLPADKPFVAQVVSARLSGTDFPQNPSEIVPPDRTLRPYDVPMLPYSKEAEANQPSAVNDATAASATPVAKGTDLG
jgi:hypothetical protein